MLCWQLILETEIVLGMMCHKQDFTTPIERGSQLPIQVEQ